MPKTKTTLDLLGAVFDWDGIIIDSAEQHREAWAIMAEELRKPLAANFFKLTFGMRNEQIIPEFTPWAEPGEHAKIAELADRKEALYREVVRRDGIAPLDGVVEFLEALNAAGVPCSVGSSTPLKNIETIIEVIGLGHRFQAISGAEDVTRGKPAPDIFITAAGKVNRLPEHCIVFEDAHVGIAAGKAAGSKVIAVATTHPLEALGEADLAVKSLAEVTIDRMLDLLG
ncbi:MAG: HAD family phosphatase [Verrucomicrobia bacterium]|nr:HAD family phosphatase [Verrucomicrobiota bacterium]